MLASQPDIGQTILIFITWLALIFISGINLVLFFSFFSLILFSLISLILLFPKFEYILIRISSFFDPLSGNNYQSEKASEAIISGGFFGKGIGEGILKNKFPNDKADIYFARANILHVEKNYPIMKKHLKIQAFSGTPSWTSFFICLSILAPKR